MTPDEQQAQRMKALADGNRIRLYRAEVKRDVARGAMRPGVPFATRDERLEGMRVADYLKAVPGLGPVRLRQAQGRCRFTESTTIGQLNERQRTWLMMWLREHIERTAQWQDAAEQFKQVTA